MTPERYQRVRSVFHAVAGAPAERRESVLAEECGSATDHRREVEAQMTEHKDRTSFLE